MNKTIKNAGIAGILSIIITIPVFVLETQKAINPTLEGILTIEILVSLLSFVFYVFFMWGFKIIGEKTNTNLLTITSYIYIISSIFFYSYFIFSAISPELENVFIDISSLVFFGAVGIPFGIGLLKLESRFGSIVTATGVLTIIQSISYLTVILSLFGIILLIPIYILQVILLFKASREL